MLLKLSWRMMRTTKPRFLWKFVRKTFFKDKYRDTFAKFCTQLDDFFANLDQYRQELASLITENFELIPDGWQVSLSS